MARINFKNKFSYKTISKGARKGKLLNKVINENSGKLYTATRNIRNTLNKELNVQVETNNNFFQKLGKAFRLFTPTEVARIKEYVAVETFTELRTSLDKLSGALRKAKMRAPGGWEHDHESFVPINVSLSMTIVVLTEAIVQMESGSTFKSTTVGTNTGIPNKSISGLKTIVNELRALRFLSENLTELWKGGKNPKELALAIKNKGQIDISSIKEKDLSFGDGKKVRINTMLKSDHLPKSIRQGAIGGARIRALGGASKPSDIPQAMQQFGEALINSIRKEGIDNITGSKSLKAGRQENFKRLARGQKQKKIKTKTSTPKNNINYGMKFVPKRLTNHLIDEADGNITAAAALLGTKIDSANRSRRRSRESGETQKELNKLRARINRRLGAAIRRNMGRPALINRTGRFSNSAVLLNLQPRGETQVQGDFSYLLYPYATFERSDKWDPNYDPRPLIKKSIRDLALELSEQKFTFYLRRI
jgi:hypothetical protein